MTKTKKTNTCHTPTCGISLSSQEMLDNPDHGWTWSNDYGWGCPQHPAPRVHVYGSQGVQLVTSWGDVFHYVGDVPADQGGIDHLAIKCGMRPPVGFPDDCSFCKMVEANGGFGPRHYASSGCQSGGRSHCTCDTCF